LPTPAGEGPACLSGNVMSGLPPLTDYIYGVFADAKPAPFA
jgi:hypothetical protein